MYTVYIYDSLYYVLLTCIVLYSRVIDSKVELEIYIRYYRGIKLNVASHRTKLVYFMYFIKNASVCQV